MSYNVENMSPVILKLEIMELLDLNSEKNNIVYSLISSSITWVGKKLEDNTNWHMPVQYRDLKLLYLHFVYLELAQICDRYPYKDEIAEYLSKIKELELKLRDSKEVIQ